MEKSNTYLDTGEGFTAVKSPKKVNKTVVHNGTSINALAAHLRGKHGGGSRSGVEHFDTGKNGIYLVITPENVNSVVVLNGTGTPALAL